MAKKKIIISSIPLVVSAFISFLFTLGIISGFVGTHWVQKKIIGRKKIVLAGLGKRKLHLHHWIMGGLFLLLLWLTGAISIFPKFCLGGTVGIICHDLYTDKGWYKVFVRK